MECESNSILLQPIIGTFQLICLFLLLPLCDHLGGWCYSFSAQSNKQILAVFREWTPISVNANENNKVVADRASRDKTKKLKNLLAESVPAEHLVTLKWVLV